MTASSLELWYRRPAAAWEEALPIGNGALGAMVFGGTARERLQLNHDSLWSWGPEPPPRWGAHRHLAEIRRLLFAGEHAAAEALVERELLGLAAEGRSHQTLGELTVELSGLSSPTAYRRGLELGTGIATTSFVSDGISFQRRAFASAPDRVLVVELEASGGALPEVSIGYERLGAARRAAAADTLVFQGAAQLPGSPPGVRFELAVRLRAPGATMERDADRLRVRGAERLTVVVACVTDYDLTAPGQRRASFPAVAAELAAAAAARPDLRARAVADHAALMERVELTLGDAPAPALPTDERLAAVRAGADDPRLLELYFQYGRYLLVACSRPGTLPANLQGLWNPHLTAPWSADYHLNINLQMNYWPVEVAHLPECHLPLFDFVESLAATSARRVAREVYATRGAAAHYTTDAWLGASTNGRPVWAMWPHGFAWCARHFLEHYWFTGDRAFLAERAWPVLRDAALFYVDWLVEDPRTGLLVSGPSASPENTFLGADGAQYSVSMGCAMDQELAWDALENYLEAARALGIRDREVEEVERALARLARPRIGDDGRLLEWAEPLPEAEPGHRHLSHLFGLFPGRQFTLRSAPEVVAAARASIEHRLAHGGGHTGWSRAWIAAFWARFREGDRALAELRALLAQSTHPNLLDDHPPFQIDGNFGAVAAIAELLLQSHDERVELLPALPSTWRAGSARGLRARGGFEVSLWWRQGALARVELRADAGGSCCVACGERERGLTLAAGELRTLWGPELATA